jgi:hypothetical protein
MSSPASQSKWIVRSGRVHSYLAVPTGLNWVLPPLTLLQIGVLTLLTTSTHLHLVHFNPEDGSSIFFLNPSISL